MGIESTPEYQLHLKTLSMRDDLYNNLFDGVEIKRFEHDDDFILDTKFHIDVQLTLRNGSILLGQEKILSPHFSKFNTFTMEFYQNRYTKERGEFFNIASQYYLHGYASRDMCHLDKYVFVDMLQFIDWLRDTPLNELELNTRPSGGSRASFYYIDYKNIPDEFILYSYNIE